MTTDTLNVITNCCDCEDYCDGWCWNDTTEMFSADLSEWFESGIFAISGFPTWHGPTGGFFEAETVLDFLTAITPDRADWSLQYRLPVVGEPFTAIVSHHDASGQITVTPIPGSEV